MQDRLVCLVYSPADAVLWRICAFVRQECGEYSSVFAPNKNHADRKFLQILKTANWSSRAQRCHNTIQMFFQGAFLLFRLYRRIISLLFRIRQHRCWLLSVRRGDCSGCSEWLCRSVDCVRWSCAGYLGFEGLPIASTCWLWEYSMFEGGFLTKGIMGDLANSITGWFSLTPPPTPHHTSAALLRFRA